MSDTDNKAAPEANPRLAINTGVQDSATAAFNADGTVDQYTSKESVGVSFNADGTTSRTDLRDADDIEAEVDASLNEEEGGDKETPKDGDTTEEGGEFDLPDFDGDNEEVFTQYKERYVSEGGELNFEAFNKSFYQSIASGAEKPDINPNERAFVKKQLGVSDAAIDTYLAGVADKAKAADAALYSRFDTDAGKGKEAFEAAYAWATSPEGGYSKEQRARFNEAIKAGGTALEDQLDLLKTRYAASKGGQQEQPVVRKEKRKASPEASATTSTPSGTPAVEPYKDLQEYSKAMAAASAKNDRKAMQEVEARLKASPKLWRGR